MTRRCRLLVAQAPFVRGWLLPHDGCQLLQFAVKTRGVYAVTAVDYVGRHVKRYGLGEPVLLYRVVSRELARHLTGHRNSIGKLDGKDRDETLLAPAPDQRLLAERVLKAH